MLVHKSPISWVIHIVSWTFALILAITDGVVEPSPLVAMTMTTTTTTTMMMMMMMMMMTATATTTTKAVVRQRHN